MLILNKCVTFAVEKVINAKIHTKHIITNLIAMKKLFVTLFVGVAANLMAQPQVSETSFSYYLPKTALRFALKIEKKTYTPGVYCKYTKKYFMDDGVKQDVETEYSVVNLGLTSIGVTDKSKLYTVELRGKNKGANVILDEDGRFLAFNAEPRIIEQRPPFVPQPKTAPIDPMTYLPKEIVEIENEEQRVEKIAAFMAKVIENMQKVKAGETVEGCTDSYEQLKEKDKELTRLFYGTVTTDTTEQVIVIVPEGEVQREVAFRLNQKTGIASREETIGTPYYLSVKDMHSTPKEPSELKKENKQGCIPVNVPGRIKVTIHKENEFMGEFDLYAGQYGFIEELSGSLFKNYKTHIIVNPVTGSVDRIKADM